jgi:hypothetical protein
MKVVNVKLNFLDKVGAIITSENLPILFNNNPDQIIGNCKVFRNDNGNCIGTLELDDDVDEDLFFYYSSWNTNDGTYWFTGLSLATNLYRDKIATRLSEMIIT